MSAEQKESVDLNRIKFEELYRSFEKDSTKPILHIKMGSSQHGWIPDYLTWYGVLQDLLDRGMDKTHNIIMTHYAVDISTVK